jgi:arylsulfatase A-like enzyme
MRERAPNIVFVMADQLPAAQVGCYGSGVDSTPTLDRLAAEGLRFDRCYATSPICAPNRATLLTGRSPAIHGLVENCQALPNDTPTYAHLLQRRGYRTGGFGKFHQTPMRMPAPQDASFLGFDESWITEDVKWPWAEYIAEHHAENLDEALALCWTFWNKPQTHLRDEAVKAVERILKPRQDASPHRIMFESPVPADLHDTAVITGLGIDFVERHLAEHPDEPFLCHLSYVDPHDPYDPPHPYASMFNPEDMPAPIPGEWTEESFPTLEAGQRFADFDRLTREPQTMAKMRALYHGTLKLMDDQIARLINVLEEKGVRGQTVFVFTTDHGDLLGDHALPTKGIKPYDTGIRCPLILAGPGIETGVVDDLVCTLDFFPSFCDLAGIPEEERIPHEGRSFVPGSRGEKRDAVLVGYQNMHTVVTDDRWRLTVWDGEDGGQLFDLANDPQEQQNRYHDPDCAARRERMLRELIRLQNEPALVPHYRTLPLVDGRRADRGLPENASWPDIDLPRSPVL